MCAKNVRDAVRELLCEFVRTHTSVRIRVRVCARARACPSARRELLLERASGDSGSNVGLGVADSTMWLMHDFSPKLANAASAGSGQNSCGVLFADATVDGVGGDTECSSRFGAGDWHLTLLGLSPDAADNAAASTTATVSSTAGEADANVGSEECGDERGEIDEINTVRGPNIVAPRDRSSVLPPVPSATRKETPW